MVHGYCTNCDRVIEFTERTVFKSYDDHGSLYANIQCPHCDEYEEVLLEQTDYKKLYEDLRHQYIRFIGR